VLMRVLLTWSDRGVDRPPPGHHQTRRADDKGPIARLLRVRHEDGLPDYDLVFVLTTPAGRRRAGQLVRSLSGAGELVETAVSDPSDHAALFAAALRVRDALPPDAEVDLLLSAGTPQAQTVWVVMAQAGLFSRSSAARVRMLQVIPPAFVPHPHPHPIREVRLDISGFPEIRALRDEVAALRAELHGELPDMVGDSLPMRTLARRLGRVAPSKLPVLVLGETGTGKELVARALHLRSRRAEGPFVAESCGALAESVLESELFGHEAGAFTGAVARHRGLFARAHGGTLFLDEVGELSPRVQVRLLRVLQEGRVRPVGGEQERAVDVRVVAATHRDLQAMVREGTFREDLWYRLRGATLRVPALRERLDDLPALVARFLADAGRPALEVDPAVWKVLAGHPWPGNVRELRAEVVRWTVFCDRRVTLADLSAELVGARPQASAAEGPFEPLALRVARTEAAAIAEALDAAGSIRGAARLLGIDRNTLKRKMQREG